MTPAIDLATLSVADLRRLLDRAEARGQVALAEQIRLTLAERAQGGQAVRPRRGADDETPELRLPADLTGPEPPRAAESFAADDDAWVLTISTERRRAPKSQRRRTVPRLLAGAACLAAAAVAWALSGVAPPWRPKPPPPAPRAMEAYVAAPPPVLHPPAAAEETAQLPPRLSPEDVAEATTEPAAAPALVPERQAPADPCGALPTAAERMLCADPSLKAQHRQLQEAYIRALNSRADPKALDAGQAAFRLAVSRAETPERLAELYDRRIRELNAATAEARLRLNAY